MEDTIKTTVNEKEVKNFPVWSCVTRERKLVNLEFAYYCGLAKLDKSKNREKMAITTIIKEVKKNSQPRITNH